MKFKIKNGVVKTTKNVSIIAGGIFAFTGTSLIVGSVINNTGINWQDVLTISSATATTGTLLSTGYYYRSKVLKEMKNKNHQ